MPSEAFHQADSAAQFLISKTPLRPKVGIVLGSGLGGFADELSEPVRIPYSQIPSFPHSTAIGHAGHMVIGNADAIPIAAMQGRVHLYEGYTPQQVAFPIRVFGRMGIRAVILTNAAGGINLAYKQGALVVISDHINLQGHNPLVGENDECFGIRYPDMTMAYWEPYRKFAREEAQKLGIEIHQGVYAGMLGPSFETPAEIRYLRTIGADAVGMSTVHEAIVARHMGVEVLGISCITNMAAGVLPKPLDHREVMETARRVRGQFIALLEGIIGRI